MSAPLFWVLSEVDIHLTVPHPRNGLPAVLVFSTMCRLDQFILDNPQKHTNAKGVFEDDVKVLVRQWMLGGIEYFVVDPEGPRQNWVPRPLSDFQDARSFLAAEGERRAAEAEIAAAREAAARKAADLADLKAELRAKLYPSIAVPPEPPPPPKPWYEAHGLD